LYIGKASNLKERVKNQVLKNLKKAMKKASDLEGEESRSFQLRSKSKTRNKIKVISLAKKENKLFIEGQKPSTRAKLGVGPVPHRNKVSGAGKPILLKSLPKEIFNLILQLRDEAHRFAISYHRKLRDMTLLEN